MTATRNQTATRPEHEAEVQAAPEPLTITMHDPESDAAKALDFTQDLDTLDAQFKRAERVLSVDDPDGSGKTINFKIRALTSVEQASLTQAALSKEDLGAIVSKVMEVSEKGEKLETNDITDLIVQKMGDNPNDATNERFLRKIVMGIEAPKGLTIERLRGWNPSLLETFHNIIEDLELENDLWVLRSVPENQEQADKAIADLDINKS